MPFGSTDEFERLVGTLVPLTSRYAKSKPTSMLYRTFAERVTGPAGSVTDRDISVVRSFAAPE